MKGRVLIAAVLLAASSGCATGYLNETYGRRSGGGAGSINGTSALAEMFKQAGHRVRSWRHLSPSLEDADVIVWLPHQDAIGSASGAPSVEAVEWLDEWLLYSQGHKTLIYVGDDWRAAVEYWSQTQAAAPAADQVEFGQRLTEAKTQASSRLAAKVDRDECGWMRVERGNAKTSVRQLTGPFAEGIDARQAGLEHWSNLHDKHESSNILLADGRGHPLVSEVVFDASGLDWTDKDSRLILVENAGFLLNGALVNHERRKLAGRLITRIGPPRQRVVFLEAGPAPLVRDTDPNPRPPTGLELFGIWPVGAILAQVAALFVVYACARWPIFGVPRRLRDPSLTDFGRHVRALARLLAATRDRSYAVTQLKAYFQVSAAKPREGVTPVKSAVASPPGAGSAAAPPSRETTAT